MRPPQIQTDTCVGFNFGLETLDENPRNNGVRTAAKRQTYVCRFANSKFCKVVKQSPCAHQNLNRLYVGFNFDMNLIIHKNKKLLCTPFCDIILAIKIDFNQKERI